MKKSFRFVTFFLIFASFLIFTLTSCENVGAYFLLGGTDDVDDRYDGFLPLPSNEIPSVPSSADGIYSGILITDVHIGAYDVTESDEAAFLLHLKALFSSEEESLRPRFIICLGDSADGGHEAEFARYALLLQSIRELAKDCGVVSSSSDFKIYSVIGNHDLYNSGAGKWKKYVYPHISSYCFTIPSTTVNGTGFSYYFIDTGNGAVGLDQLEDLETLVKADSHPKIVSTHYPMCSGGSQIITLTDTSERNYLLSLYAENNVKALFGGHSHLTFELGLGKMTQYNTAALFKDRAFRLFTVNEKTSSVTTRLIQY